MAADTRSRIIPQVFEDTVSEKWTVSGGFPVEWFLTDESELEAFLCEVCRDVMNNPRQCRNGHDNCKSCLSKCSHCPHKDCHVKFSDNPPTTSPLIINDLIMDLQVQCDVCIDKTCGWTGSLAQLLQKEGVCKSRKKQKTEVNVIETEQTISPPPPHPSSQQFKWQAMKISTPPTVPMHPQQVITTQQTANTVIPPPLLIAPCLPLTVKCSECHACLPVESVATHKQTNCPQAMVRCSGHEVGCCISSCKGKVKRVDNAAHLQAASRDPGVILKYIERIKVETSARVVKPIPPAVHDVTQDSATTVQKLVLPAPWKPTTLLKAAPVIVKPPAFSPVITINFVTGCYKGQLKNGNRHGTGTMTYNNDALGRTGCVYTGEWCNNQRNGRGVMCYLDGSKYEGDWKDSLKQGVGKMSNPGIGSYSGDWIADKATGHGTLTRADGQVYCGAFRDGVCEGEGILTLQNGTTCAGKFVNNELQGGCDIQCALSGNTFNGHIIDGNITGYGMKRYKKSGDVYSWRAGQFSGKGLLQRIDGTSYNGFWSCGERHGEGEERDSEGRVMTRKEFNMHTCAKCGLVRCTCVDQTKWPCYGMV